MLVSCSLFLVAAAATTSPPRLVAAEVRAAPFNVQSGGIAACDVSIDEQGSVASAEVVQDVAPYGALLGEDVRSWRFEPALEDGRPVASQVLVLGFFRPPELTFAAPENPRYKTTVAPDEIPWPTSVAVPAYPPNAVGSGKVVLEADVSDEGAVTRTRVLTPASAFDGAAVEAVQKWVFRPAQRGNREVPSRAFMVLSFIGATP